MSRLRSRRSGSHLLLKIDPDKVERLELVVRGCVDSCAKNGDRVVALDQCRQPLVQEGFLAVVISDLSDALLLLLYD